jgi:hypothetical protein
MPVINLSPDEKKRVRRIILFHPRPAKIHRKAVILYQLSRWDDVQKLARHYRLKSQAIASVLDEFRSKGLEGTIAVVNDAEEHRELLGEVETRAPDRDRFRTMLDRFPAPDRWLDDDDDWDLG